MRFLLDWLLPNRSRLYERFYRKVAGVYRVLVAAFFCAHAQAQLPQFISTNAFPGLGFSQPVCLTTPPGETNRLSILEKKWCD